MAYYRIKSAETAVKQSLSIASLSMVEHVPVGLKENYHEIHRFPDGTMLIQTDEKLDGVKEIPIDDPCVKSHEDWWAAKDNPDTKPSLKNTKGEMLDVIAPVKDGVSK